ncbi:MAG TPA: hypothetical protein VGP28_09830 [Methylocella sp.]|jgi:hypothetical protein|nr:hypothetical protein [Methylocella sp.]
MNRRGWINSTSIYKGVSRVGDQRKWLARIGLDWTTIRLGHFVDEHLAAAHYNMAARILFGPYAVFNEIPEELSDVQLSDRALDKINRAMFGERIDWLTAMRAQAVHM